MKNRAQYIVNKTRNTSNGSVRKAIRSTFWCIVALHPDEILRGPSETMSDMKKREEELIKENEKLRREVEGEKHCRSAGSILKLGDNSFDLINTQNNGL